MPDSRSPRASSSSGPRSRGSCSPGIAERGTDATGYGYHAADGSVQVHKESVCLREFVEHVAVPEGAGEAIFHVRGYTKGVPSLNDNNHPVRYGRAVVVHNGHLDNDDALFRRYGAPRSTPHITVDSEAIAMLADRTGDIAATLAEVRGSAAVGVLWEGEPGRLTLARRASRTLCLGHGDGFVLFASTPEPLELAARATGPHGAHRGDRRGPRARVARRAASSRAAASTSTGATSASRS